MVSNRGREINVPAPREYDSRIAESAVAGFRVFIAGKEVTNDVLSLKIQLHDGNQTSMAQVVLSNEFDKYVITPDEMAALAGIEDLTGIFIDELENEARRRVSERSAPQPPFSEESFRRIENETENEQFSAEELRDLVQNELPGLVAKETIGTFDRIFPGDIYKDKREMMNQKFFQGFLLKGGGGNIFLKDLKEQKENTSSPPSGPFPRLDGWVPRYQIYSGSTIFHTSDVIRIFLQDPYDPYVWYYGFSGYLTDDSDIVDVNNNKHISFTCEDVTRSFKYSRFTVNPQIANPEALLVSTDTVIYAGLKEPFKRLSIPESFFVQVFGGEPLGISNNELAIETRSGENLEGVDQGFIKGVGNFDLKNSKVFILGDEPTDVPRILEPQGLAKAERKFYQNIKDKIVRNFDLRTYQSYLDHRVRYEDLAVERQNDSEEVKSVKRTFAKSVQDVLEQQNSSGVLNLPIQESPIWSTMSMIGGFPDVYPIDGRLIMILPGSLNPTTNTEVLTNELAGFSVNQTNFISKFSTLKMYAERLDFSLYASPRGDLLFEMPFYDFHPDDFGVDTTLPPGANRNIYTEQRGETNAQMRWPVYKGPASSKVINGPGSKAQAQQPEGPSYSHAYTLWKNHQIGEYSRSFSDAAIRTILTSAYFVIPNNPNIGDSSKVLGENIDATAESLIASFGARYEHINPHGYLGSAESAKLFAEIQLNKINAAATNISIGIDAKFDLWINRPIRIAHKEILGTLRSVTHSINIGGKDLSTSSMQLNNARFWTGGIDENQTSIGGEKRRVYEPIGTNASKPIDYSELFRLEPKKKPTARKPTE